MSGRDQSVVLICEVKYRVPTVVSLELGRLQEELARLQEDNRELEALESAAYAEALTAVHRIDAAKTKSGVLMIAFVVVGVAQLIALWGWLA